MARAGPIASRARCGCAGLADANGEQIIESDFQNGQTYPTVQRSAPGVGPDARLLPALASCRRRGVVRRRVGTLVFDEPERADIEITNPTVFALSIGVTDSERDGWQPTARLGPGVTRTIQDVIDQGEVWVIRFGGQGRDGDELESPATISTTPKAVKTPVVGRQRAQAG